MSYIKRKYKYEELSWNNPQVDIEHDIMEAEREEYNDINLSIKLMNKLNK